jgi:hypothetical protein
MWHCHFYALLAQDISPVSAFRRLVQYGVARYGLVYQCPAIPPSLTNLVVPLP